MLFNLAASHTGSNEKKGPLERFRPIESIYREVTSTSRGQTVTETTKQGSLKLLTR